jgi:hypothetical protein
MDQLTQFRRLDHAVFPQGITCFVRLAKQRPDQVLIKPAPVMFPGKLRLEANRRTVLAHRQSAYRFTVVLRLSSVASHQR